MPSREDVWKAQYLKLIKFKEEQGHTKVPRTDNEALYIWCYNQRKKHRDGHSSMNEERVQQLNDVGFVWDIQSTPGRGRPRTTKALTEIKKSKESKKTATDNPTNSKAVKRTSLKTKEGKQDALASAAAAAVVAMANMADLDDEDMSDAASPKTSEPVVPNKTFLQKSYSGVAWIGNSAKDLVKMFVSF